MKATAFASLVVYVREEPEAVVDLLERHGTWLAKSFELSEIVVVDDGSTDGTAAAAARTAALFGLNVVVVRLARRHGVEAAMKAGLDRAVGDWIYELESPVVDFEPALLGDLYEQAARGADVVTAAGDEGPWKSRLFYRVVNRYALLDAPLKTERVRLSSRRALNGMLTMSEKVRYRKALYAVLGGRQEHIVYRPTRPVQHGRRADRETTTLAFDVLLSFSGFGMRVAHALSFAFGLLSMLGVFYALSVYLTKRDVVEGWTTVTVVLCGGLAGIFLVLGILGEYLARILVEVRARPLYAVSSVTTVDRRDAPLRAQEPSAFMRDQLGGGGP